MALNVPSGNKKRITFGPGILYMGATNASGTTPATIAAGSPGGDIGYVRAASLTITRSKLDVFQGSPRSLIETYAVQEDVAFNIASIEVNPLQFYFALGSGVTASAAGVDQLDFGGQVTFQEVGLLFRHKSPTEGTVDLYLWKCQPVGEITMPFGDDVQETAFNFRALEALTQWGGATTGTNKRLMQLKMTVAP